MKVFETLNVEVEGAVAFVEIAAPPMNLLGPELVRDFVDLPYAQRRIRAAMTRGFQTRGAETNLGQMLGDIEL